jgi:uncharacterized membrane protein
LRSGEAAAVVEMIMALLVVVAVLQDHTLKVVLL